MRVLLFYFSFLMATVPSFVEATVYISEVAWMGTADDANAEWIELYNNGPIQDVSGWTLNAVDGQPSITLTGSMGANTYALLERTSDETVPNVPAFFVYTGALGNTGEKLELRDQNGVLVDSVDGSDGWSVGGDNTTKETLQRSGEPAVGAWGTGVATPQGETAIMGVESQDLQNTSSQNGLSGGNILYGSKDTKETVPHLKPALTLDLGEERTVTVGVPTTYLARAFKEKGEEIVVSNVVWNFGDGTVKKGREVTHTYQFTGDYLVSVTGTRSGFLREITDTEQLVVHVVESSVEIVHADATCIEVKNKSKEAVELSDFVFVSGGQHFKIPKNTVLLPNTSVRFPHKTTKVTGHTVSLFRPDGSLVSTYGAFVPSVPKQLLATASAVKNAPPNQVEATQEQTSIFDTLELSTSLPEFTNTANAFEGSGQHEEKDTRLWWWILGLVTAICTAVLAVSLVRMERSEVIEGYMIEDEE
jgi:hypothetical protein